MKRTKYSIFIILFALLCPSCNSRKKSSHNDREIIAELGEEVLYTDELNTIIKQELFDELNKIYEIKKKAVEQLINVKLLQKEADKKQLSYQQYIDNYTDNQIQRLGIDSLSKRYNLKSIIEFRDANMYNPQIQISAESETKRSIFREKDKTKRSKKESAQHSKSRNKSFVMTSVSAL